MKTKTVSPEMFKAMVSLLKYYQFENDKYTRMAGMSCPLCSAANENCEICAWTIFMGTDCLAYVRAQTLMGLNKIDKHRINRTFWWRKLRIYQLKKWISHSFVSLEKI